MEVIKKLLFYTLLTLPIAATAGDAPDASLHLDWLDKSVSPTTDFFSYADGNWAKINPIPAGYSSWNLFYERYRKNQEIIHDILEDLTKKKNLIPGSIQRQGADFYASGMDVQAIDAAGIKPLEPEIARINTLKNKAGLESEIAHLQMIGVSAAFNFGQMQDLKDSSRVIGTAFQAGIGLPDRDYYLEASDICPPSTSVTDTGSQTYAACSNRANSYQKIRAAYRAHIAKTFELMGETEDKASSDAESVINIETDLASASMSDVDQRDPENVYHIMTLVDLDKLTPNFPWKPYFAAIGHPEIMSINLQMPNFFKAFNAEFSRISLDHWKTYLQWQLVNTYAPYLSEPFMDENAAFNAITTGAHQVPSRWQQVLSAATGSQDNFQTFDLGMGYVLGRLYVDKVFTESSRRQALEILESIRDALKNDLQTLSWMSPVTRRAAIHKLDLMGVRIGYPDKWPDYSSLKINRGPYVLNVLSVKAFFQRSELDKIGRPMDTRVWNMLPQTVNADYETSMNNINFPAGILQPPFFDPSAPAAVNYGLIGTIMGHEITHGFDDQGSLYDGHGNVLPTPGWWTPEDFAKFKTATDCISTQFSQYMVDGGLHIQGGLVTGEATADLGGLMLAWHAFHASKAYQHAKMIDGFSPDQQFFLAAAHEWVVNKYPEEVLLDITTNPHPPGKYRVNGTLANMPQFQQTFNLSDDSPMVNKVRCVIW